MLIQVPRLETLGNNSSDPALSGTVLTTVPHQLHSAIFLQPSRLQQLPLCELRQPPLPHAGSASPQVGLHQPSMSATLASLRLCAAPNFFCVTLAGFASHLLASALLETTSVTLGRLFLLLLLCLADVF